MRFLLTSILSLLICISISAESTYSTVTDIHYSSKNDDYSRKRLSLDVHHDRNVKDMPVIVWFHGGGLTGGNKFVPAELTERGYVVVAPNYRLIPEVDVEQCIDDAAEAVAWTFRNIEKYGGDPRKYL